MISRPITTFEAAFPSLVCEEDALVTKTHELSSSSEIFYLKDNLRTEISLYSDNEEEVGDYEIYLTTTFLTQDNSSFKTYTYLALKVQITTFVNTIPAF